MRGDATAARYGFTIEWSPFGGFTLYEMRGSDYVWRRFLFTPVREACASFRRDLRGARA